MYPNDEQFQETTIAKVRNDGDGWSIERADGWSFYVPASSPIVPKEGMAARFYGGGIGFAVRGLFLDGERVFYRTEAEDEEKREIDIYGADAADWLKRWDEGASVWSIEMGGIGPGYEQCIQITLAEILRHLLERKYEPATWDENETWERDRTEIQAAGFSNARISSLGLSGAQWGAAMNLAIRFYRDGPRIVMTDERVKDRHIQVRRIFPQPAGGEDARELTAWKKAVEQAHGFSIAWAIVATNIKERAEQIFSRGSPAIDAAAKSEEIR